MRINNNIMALNTHRQLGLTANGIAKSMEKLSSGLRINRAGDDAAGLAISEKMRAQIRGLKMASKNAADMISLIQTAEGALNETHSILQRMRELSVQAANDTNTASDRSEIQAEIAQLIKEIDRIGNTTEFNTKKLLDGSAQGVSDPKAATAQINGNSGMVVNTDAQNEFLSKVGGDINFFMDGAHILSRVNVTTDTLGNQKFSLENDYRLVGPDGTEYAFVKGDSVKGAGLDGLTTNSILNGNMTINSSGALGYNITLGGALTEADIDSLRAGSTLVAGSRFTVAGNQSVAISVNDASVLVSFDGDQLKVGNVILAVNKSITLQDGTILTRRAGGEIEVTKGSVTLASDIVAAAGVNSTANVTAFTLAANSVMAVSEIDLRDSGHNLVKDVNPALGSATLATNVIVGKGSTIAAGSVLNADSVLAAGSMFTVGDQSQAIVFGGGAGSALFIDAATGLLSSGAGGLTRLADGTYSFEGAVIAHNGNGSVTILSGSLKLNGATGVGGDAGRITHVADGSLLTEDTVLNFRSGRLVTGAEFREGRELKTGSVIASAGNEIIRGGITIGNDGKSVTFAGRHTLVADITQIGVGLTHTFAFSSYAAGSNDLGNSFMAQIGANSGQTLFISISDMRARALGVEKIDVSTRNGAATAMTKIDNALQKVSHQRAMLGAAQNRLESTIRSLDNAAENLQAAESRIRDIDMAREIMELTRLNILQQVAQAMLAQANQAPQSVLRLLQ